MFDPLRIRRNDNRYFSRKGQIMQVKPIANFPGVFINPKHVEHYKQYIINNGLITRDEIPGTDPTIQKVSFESDDPMTFSDILDKFPANCIPVKVDLYTS